MTAMAEIDSDSHPIHFRNRLPSKKTQSTIGRFETPIAVQTPFILGKLHNANTHVPEQLDIRQAATQPAGSPKNEYQAQLPPLLPLGAIYRISHPTQSFRSPF